eukprot:scaffold142054_cov51-Prasinocladus_malaysianus.AAC.4
MLVGSHALRSILTSDSDDGVDNRSSSLPPARARGAALEPSSPEKLKRSGALGASSMETTLWCDCGTKQGIIVAMSIPSHQRNRGQCGILSSGPWEVMIFLAYGKLNEYSTPYVEVCA